MTKINLLIIALLLSVSAYAEIKIDKANNGYLQGWEYDSTIDTVSFYIKESKGGKKYRVRLLGAMGPNIFSNNECERFLAIKGKQRLDDLIKNYTVYLDMGSNHLSSFSAKLWDCTNDNGSFVCNAFDAYSNKNIADTLLRERLVMPLSKNKVDWCLNMRPLP